ncbi:MAG TPA: pyrophosphatase PpaX [Bacillales bacterium]|nr:pyrophosphatase PpaX [Bacillales bacterium]
MNVETVLFDLDGTLINTNDLIIASFSHTLERYFPNRFGKDDIVGFIGEPLRDSFYKIDPTLADEMVSVYREHNIAHHDELVREYEGVYETVQVLKAHRFKLGIVTTKARKTVEMGLKLTGLASFFETVVTIDDVKEAKPSPEPILKALRILEARAETALMVGDSPHDISAGKNAGTATAGVEWAVKGSEVLRKMNPDVMLEKMPQLLDVLKVAVK